jgi:hypothetical protein
MRRIPADVVRGPPLRRIVMVTRREVELSGRFIVLGKGRKQERTRLVS